MKKRTQDFQKLFLTDFEPIESNLNEKNQELFKCKKCQKIFESEESLKNHISSYHSNRIKCEFCTKDFSKNNFFEVHIKTEHEEAEKFKCEICEMTFVLEWRLKKHRNIHTEQATNMKFCHYYNNNKTCPFSDLGCIFRHEDYPHLSKQKQMHQ